MIMVQVAARYFSDQIALVLTTNTEPTAIAQIEGPKREFPRLMSEVSDALVVTALQVIEPDDVVWESHELQVRWNRLTGCRRQSGASIAPRMVERVSA